MKTRIGNLVVATVQLAVLTPCGQGFTVWATTLMVECPMDHPEECLPDVHPVFDHLTSHEAWVEHALYVGSLRLGRELPPGPVYAAEQRAAVLRQMFRTRRPRPVFMPAMLVYRIFTGEMPPVPALAPTAPPVNHQAAG